MFEWLFGTFEKALQSIAERTSRRGNIILGVSLLLCATGSVRLLFSIEGEDAAFLGPMLFIAAYAFISSGLVFIIAGTTNSTKLAVSVGGWVVILIPIVVPLLLILNLMLT